ncbi:MAG: phosphoribosylamine--glycine ligase [Gemmatimonadales bacterium]|nr:MAG: phosphoribosylamine--glycine ligase [Gemmatimonadales bacterium]
MKILIIGHGGREHALLWKLRADAPQATFYATRPNPGMAPHCIPVDLAPDDVDGLATWAEGEDITLTVVGPEVPLARGIADRFRKRGLPLFGPSAAAVRLESSKAFAKELMQRCGVPTADYRCFTRWPEAERFIREHGAPVVVKASGLAAGKGAVVCTTEEEALEAARTMLRDDAFGDAGREIVVESFMEGEELSVFGVTDGRHVIPLLPSQDHKAVGEGDTGPNTGGMGAYAPVPGVGPELLSTISEEIFLPILDAMERAATPFRGLLYAGLMLTSDGPKVVEFNGRFGDPETQVVLPLLDSPLLELMVSVARGGSIADAETSFSNRTALNTVLTSGGYPGEYERGHTVTIPEELRRDPDLLVFHAGTRKEGDQVVTSGGRVLSVVGLGDTLGEARERSLGAAEKVSFQGKTFRRDIGWRAAATEEAAAY